MLVDDLIERLTAQLAKMRLPATAPLSRAAMAGDAAAIGAAILPFLDQLLPSDAILMQAGRVDKCQLDAGASREALHSAE